MLDKFESIGYNNQALRDADVAHPVERHLAKVEVASSSLVARSKKEPLLPIRQERFSLSCRPIAQKNLPRMKILCIFSRKRDTIFCQNMRQYG